MKIATSVKTLTILSGVLGVVGLGLLAPSASAKPERGRRNTTTTRTRTTTITRSRPVVTTRSRPVVVTRSRPVVDTRTRTVVRNRPVVIRNRPVVVRNRTTRTTRTTRYTPQSSTYNGRVTYVSGGRFGINVGGNNYNVYPSVGLPRGLNRGDYVGVVGVRTNSTIRSNRVYITRNY